MEKRWELASAGEKLGYVLAWSLGSPSEQSRRLRMNMRKG
jgi:hypothetical protein